GELLLRTAAGKLRRLDRNRPVRRLGAAGPDRVDRVALDRNKLGTCLGAGFFEAGNMIGSQKPGIVAKDLALPELALHPFIRWVIDQMMGLEQRRIDLLAHLDRVATVNEYGAPIGHQDRHAPGASKAGEPAQSLGMGSDIFPL